MDLFFLLRIFFGNQSKVCATKSKCYVKNLDRLDAAPANERINVIKRKTNKSIHLISKIFARQRHILLMFK